jgi:hypothetical protein
LAEADAVSGLSNRRLSNDQPGQSMAEIKGTREPPKRSEAREERDRRRLNALLDAALQMTFPASDPVAIIHESEPVGRTSRTLSRALE